MAPSILTGDSVPGSNSPALPAVIQRHVRRIDFPWPGSGGVLYTLQPDCTKAERLAVLAAVRELHHPIAVSMVGDEILAFGRKP